MSNLKETPENLKEIVILDSATTCDFFCNKDLLTNIRESDRTHHVRSNGGSLRTKVIGDHPLADNAPLHEDALTNLVCLSNLMKKHRVTLDSAVGPHFNVHYEDNQIIQFHQTEHGLFYYDPRKQEVVFLNSQLENSQKHTNRDILRAKKARDLLAMCGYPSIQDCKNAIKNNVIDNCPVTVKDIDIAEDMFGPDVHSLKGKTLKKKPLPVAEDYVRATQRH